MDLNVRLNPERIVKCAQRLMDGTMRKEMETGKPECRPFMAELGLV